MSRSCSAAGYTEFASNGSELRATAGELGDAIQSAESLEVPPTPALGADEDLATTV